MKQSQLPKHQKATAHRQGTAHRKATATHPKPAITHRTVRRTPLFSERATTALQILGASLAYLLYALFLSHSHRPWWIALLVGPVIFGSIGALKHGIEILFTALLKRCKLHTRRLPRGLATTLAAFIGVVLFKVATHYLG